MRILESFQQPGPQTNPYITQLLQRLRTRNQVAAFSWRTALCDSYDVFHVHWPEVLLRGNAWWKTAGRQACFALLLAKLAATNTPVVRTVHNVKPHERPSMTQHLLLTWLDRLTTGRIVLNDAAAPEGSTVILHGHYRDWLAKYPTAAVVPGRFVFAGLIREYKNIPELLEAFAKIPDDYCSLRVVGKPEPAGLGNQIAFLAAQDSRVEAALQYVDDAALVTEITQANLVVLPYRELHNSGMALMALSLNRPVLLPQTATSLALAAECPDWVHTYVGPLTAEILVKALRSVPGPHDHGAPKPDLSAREWSTTAEAHEAVFARAIQQSRTQ